MNALVRISAAAGLVLLAPVDDARAACGIGSRIWAGRDGAVATVLAFTTNFWTLKVISTTFEVSGCTENDNWFKKGANAAKQAKIEHFASENLDHLALEMAGGRGEHLAALARLIEIREEHDDELRLLAQSHFEDLFPHDHATSDEMLRTLAYLMSESPVLASYIER